MKRLALGLLLSLTVYGANAAYEPKEFNVKNNYVVSNPNRGEDGKNFFLNFVREVHAKAAEIRNNVRDNLKAAGIGRSIGGGIGGGTGGGIGGGRGIGGGSGGTGVGGGGVCR